ncbi:MAG: hypothetical protein N2999_06245 [Proteobacteria bacterium]|nr:hypothetical protein [Pseudomonadota bacterium]
MKKKWQILLFSLLISAKLSYGIEIQSISPVDIYPGSEITLSGKDLTGNITLTIADRELKALYVNNDRLRFSIPSDMEGGIYILRIRSEKKDLLPPIPLAIKRKEFSVKRFYPESIDRCGNGNFTISLEGDNLNLVKKISSPDMGALQFYSSKNKITINIPSDSLINLSSNLNIYLYDENEKIKDIVPVRVTSKPFIESVGIVEKEVTNLTLKITGRNFLYPVKLFVNGELIREKDKDFRTYNRDKSSPNLDKYEVLNCKEIVYKIYPTTFDTKDILISLENPTGERSNTYSITIP